MTKREDFPQGKRKFRDERGRFRPMNITDVAIKPMNLADAIKDTKIKITDPDTLKDTEFGYYIGPCYTPLPTEPDGTVGYIDHIRGLTVKLKPKP